MRVLFNGASTLRAKTGVGHTTINLHRALTAASPTDQFWLYPGKIARNLAKRLLKQPIRHSGSVTPPKPAKKDFISEMALRAARLGYAAHFHTIARLGRFDLYHEPNLIPFDTRL